LDSSYEYTRKDVESLEQELNKFTCLENCTPDTFVTVDNPYVKATVDEITAGLTTLKEKQKAVFEFVRDNIEDDENIFRTGRTDYWEYPEDILERGKGHFEDKYLLLMTMLRMVGTAPEHVMFIAGEVDGSDNWIWVEVYDGERWWILDPFEGYEFEEESKDRFYTNHEVVILWWFNDAAYRGGD
jgi:transglutaminase-like putative cysteine protease